jgi:predicted ATPase
MATQTETPLAERMRLIWNREATEGLFFRAEAFLDAQYVEAIGALKSDGAGGL